MIRYMAAESKKYENFISEKKIKSLGNCGF